MHGCVGNAWYVDDSPHLAEVGYFCEQARLVKTVKVHSPIAKWAMDQTVGSYLGGQNPLRGLGIAIDWVTGRSGRTGQ